MNFFIQALLLCAVLSAVQCQKHGETSVTPSSPIDTSSVKFYLNDQLTDFVPKFITYRGIEGITYDFLQTKGVFINIFGITGPVRHTVGEYGMYLSFGQYHHVDYKNHTYEIIEKENARFTITEFDAANKRVKGHFKAKFKRVTSGRETPESYLPNIITLRGEFNTKYTEY